MTGLQTLGHTLRGIAIAVSTRAVVRSSTLHGLLVAPSLTTSATGAPSDASARAHAAAHATRASFAALRQLQRAPGWRNTCLYRAIAECLVLRAFGLPATLQLGVARGGDASGAVLAHAWVQCPGYRCAASASVDGASYTPLSHVRAWRHLDAAGA